MRDGEVFHGMGEWAWAAGICPLLGPWRLGAVQCVYQREGGFDPAKQLDFRLQLDAVPGLDAPAAGGSQPKPPEVVRPTNSPFA